jgi:hypothetical protein
MGSLSVSGEGRGMVATLKHFLCAVAIATQSTQRNQLGTLLRAKAETRPLWKSRSWQRHRAVCAIYVVAIVLEV